MQIIDPATGKRIKKTDEQFGKTLNAEDPIKRNVEKSLEMEENSPMDPPDAYDGTTIEDVKYEEMDALLQQFINEHKTGIKQIEQFEAALMAFKENGYRLTDEINKAFGEFFHFFDHNILDHNQREEKQLFPLLHQKLIESGEKGEGLEPRTAIDMMEDDHVKFIQLGALTFNMLGLAARVPDERSRMFVYDVAFNNGRELIEMLRLHIFREDNILFPLAHKLISREEFTRLANGH